DSTVHTRGISLDDPSSNATVRRTKLVNFNRGIFSYRGSMSVKDSLIDLGDQEGALGFELDAQGTWDYHPFVFFDGVTIVGNGANQRGVTATANATGTGSAGINLDNTLSHLTGTDSVDVYCSRSGAVPLNVSVFYSMAEIISPQGSCAPTTLGVVTGTPLFLDTDGGDYRPAPGSPVIDAGNPGSADSGRFDLWGAVRYVNGSDFNFAGDIDIGAGEYQNYAPNKPVATATPTTVTAGSPVTFSATGSDPNGQPVTFSWEFGEGGSASGASVSRTYAVPGTYKAKAIASDGSLSKASAWVEVIVVAAPPVPLPTLVLGKPASKFSIKLMKSGAKVAPTKPKKGGSVKLTASAAIDAKVTLLRVKAGYLVGGACKAKQGKTGKAKRCDLAVGKARPFKIPAGTSYFTLGRKWNRIRIMPGTYKLKVDGLMGPRMSTNLTVAK
ncbi:MAG: PKD domain-containing protein, partial [Solirubrobacterales bacterium]